MEPVEELIAQYKAIKADNEARAQRMKELQPFVDEHARLAAELALWDSRGRLTLNLESKIRRALFERAVGEQGTLGKLSMERAATEELDKPAEPVHH